MDEKNKSEDKIFSVNLAKDQKISVPVIEEQIGVEKKTVKTGSVHISKSVYKDEAIIEVPVSKEKVIVEKKVFNTYIETPPPPIRQEGDKTIISVVREVLVVEKRLMLTEEIHITKQKTEEIVEVKESLQKEEVTVKRQK